MIVAQANKILGRVDDSFQTVIDKKNPGSIELQDSSF